MRHSAAISRGCGFTRQAALPAQETPGWTGSKRSATWAGARSHRSLRPAPRPQPLVSSRTARHVINMRPPGGGYAPPHSPATTAGSGHATLCVITARPTPLKPWFRRQTASAAFMAGAAGRHRCAPAPLSTADSRGLPSPFGSGSGPT